MNIVTVYPTNYQEKCELMEFVYKNTDSFIMNTFGFLWESRDLWSYGVDVAKDDKGNIIGLHAAHIKDINNEPHVKTYYIVTDKNRQGEGIAKKLILHLLLDATIANYSKYYVNSEINSPGVKFFKKFIGIEPEIVNNDFGTTDCVFKTTIAEILKRHEQTI